MIKARIVLIGSLLVTTAGAVAAQADDTARLKTVVVSASKVPQPASVLTQPVTVLSGEDLRARGVLRVTDALREAPSVAMVQSGSYGGLTSMFLRGGESRYTKVLIDGVPVNASGGSFDFSHLTTDNIDRIEIVRGPASVLYGADAVTCIVQIFTRRPTSSRASAAVRGGTYRSLDIDGDVSATGGLGGFTLGAAHHSTDGILPFNNEYVNGTLSSSANVGRPDIGDLKVSARYTTAEFHYPTDFVGQPVDSNSYRVQHRLTVGLDAGHNFSTAVQAHLLAGSNDVIDLTEDIAVPFGSTGQEHSAFRSRGYRRNVEGRVALFLPAASTLTLGATYEKEHENTESGAGPVGPPLTFQGTFDASRHNVAYYSELLGNPVEGISYTLSGRVDDNSDYARFATYRAGVNFGLLPTLRVRASLSNAFNAPAFAQLRPTAFTVGSPDLRPEKSRSAEVSMIGSYDHDAVTLTATYFAQRFEDLIQFVSGPPPDFRGSYANLTGASSNGAEFELSVAPTSIVRTTASYTIVEPKVTRIDPGYEGGDHVGDALLRRPTHSGSLVTSLGLSAGLNVGAAINYVGRRPDMDFSQFPSPRVTLPSYTKVDLSAELPLPVFRQGTVFINARVENVFDRHYQEVLNFAAPGRTFLVGGRWSTAF